jgi:hypothetical protein
MLSSAKHLILHLSTVFNFVRRPPECASLQANLSSSEHCCTQSNPALPPRVRAQGLSH